MTENAQNALNVELYDVACFSAQQAVELYLKGKIVNKSGSKPYTHSLVELLRIVEKLGHEAPDTVSRCAKELGEHYTHARNAFWSRVASLRDTTFISRETFCSGL